MLVIIDPNKHYAKNKQGHLIEACGLIPYFFRDAEDAGLKDAKEVYDFMVSVYGFGDYSGVNWGVVGPKGTYTSLEPEDKPLEPLVSFEIVEGCKLYVYPYAIMAVVQGNTQIISRMD